jgi:hypothetical protein
LPTHENAALVYALQKTLARRCKSPIKAPDWAATIVFSLASAIGKSIRRAGKAAMGLRDFSLHRSFQCTLLPLLTNNPKPAILRRRVGCNFHVIGARLTCTILPSAGKGGIGEGFQSADLSNNGLRGRIF